MVCMMVKLLRSCKPYFTNLSIVNACVQACLDFLLTFPADVRATGMETTAFDVPAKGT